METLINLPIQEILRLCSDDPRFVGICQENELWYRLIQRDFPCENLFALTNPKEFYLQNLLTRRQALKFPLVWSVQRTLEENFESGLYSPEDYALLSQPIRGLCRLVLYYPVEDYPYGTLPKRESFYRVEYNFDQPVSMIQLLELITDFYHQPANSIRRSTRPIGKLFKLLGDRSFIRGLYPQDDGYLLLID